MRLVGAKMDIFAGRFSFEGGWIGLDRCDSSDFDHANIWLCMVFPIDQSIIITFLIIH